MKKYLSLLVSLILSTFSFSQGLEYYLPDSVKYDPSVPTPRDIIYHEVGEWHVTHDRLVNYMQALARSSPGRVKLETMGYTYEGRPQVLLIITSPSNHQRLEEIRLQHLQLSDPSRSGSLDISKMPIVTWIGHSIHGNEQSGTNASLVSAYYLAAAQGSQIDQLLENSVILFDPSFNPDGMQRFSTWVNQHKSKNLVADNNSREFREAWPGGRYNHYWFDLNRDWLPAVHLESQNRLHWYHKWKPNILTDHHEQGSNATFFFQPGVPSRVNPLTPVKNQELTAKLARYHAQYLDRIGSLYFTKESYDDFYYGKGSTYPDIQGAIGILFEQASSRGHLQETSNGLLSFPFAIRNQFVTTLSTLYGGLALRKEFLEYQREFFRESLNEASRSNVKAYVFGTGTKDKIRTKTFFQMLSRHGIRGGFLKNNLQVEGKTFLADVDMVVPMNQTQAKLLRTIFEKNFQFRDSLFYDITSWTMPLAFGLDYAPLNTFREDMMEDPFVRLEQPAQVQGGQSSYGYLIRWTDFLAPAALYELLSKGIIVKNAQVPFTLELKGIETSFEAGTLFVPVQIQSFGAGEIFNLLSELTSKYSLRTEAIASGAASSGIDLGSSRFSVIIKPVVAMFAGTGVNALDAGEIWHLLDQRMNIPSSHLELSVFNSIDAGKYNTIIMPGGNYGSSLSKEKLKSWIEAGGTLIVTQEGINWLIQSGISNVKLKRTKNPVDSSDRLNYTDRVQVTGSQQVNGVILGADVDLTHPLAFGYSSGKISLFKSNRVFMEKSKNPYATPLMYGRDPLQSGWVSRENAEAIKNSAAVIVQTLGQGRIIHISDNPNFRAFWLGGTKLFVNAIFFGRSIDAASASGEE
jgi:hypothetical protein